MSKFHSDKTDGTDTKSQCTFFHFQGHSDQETRTETASNVDFKSLKRKLFAASFFSEQGFLQRDVHEAKTSDELNCQQLQCDKWS